MKLGTIIQNKLDYAAVTKTPKSQRHLFDYLTLLHWLGLSGLGYIHSEVKNSYQEYH